MTGSVERTYRDFLKTYRGHDAIKREYIPFFYEDLFSRGSLPNGLSKEAFHILTSYKATSTYVGGINWMHNILADIYGDGSLNQDARFRNLQLQESQTWLLIHIMDEVGEALAIGTGPNGIKKVIDHVNALLFDENPKPLEELSKGQNEALSLVAFKLRRGLEASHSKGAFQEAWTELMIPSGKESSADSMRNYRKLRQEIGKQSARLCAFFIAGAGDEQYAQMHYGKKLAGLQYSIEKMGESSILIDSYIDFERDKSEVMQGFKTRVGDRSWFLYAGLREGLIMAIKEHHRHLGHFSGAMAHYTRKMGRDSLKPFLEKLGLGKSIQHPDHELLMQKLLENVLEKPNQENDPSFIK